MSRTHVVAAALARARGRYGPGAAERKLTLLAVLEALPLKQPRELAALHDHALFLRAFPDDARVDGAARRALAGVATRVRGLPARTRADLSDSGVAGSVSRHTFAAPIAAWLVARFGPDVDIDWRDYDDTSGLDLLLGFVARRPEQDGLESARLTTRVWLRAARTAARILRGCWPSSAGRARLRQAGRRSTTTSAFRWAGDCATVSARPAATYRRQHGSSTGLAGCAGRRHGRSNGLRGRSRTSSVSTAGAPWAYLMSRAPPSPRAVARSTRSRMRIRMRSTSPISAPAPCSP